jgi:hypothetical protein
MKDIILIIIFFTISSLIILFGFKKITNNSSSAVTRKKTYLGKKFTDTIGDISIEPYGCFADLKDKFFIKKINPYSKIKQYDSGIIISEHNTKKDLQRLTRNVIKNGYDLYGNKILKIYKTSYDYENMPIKEIASLAKLSGYNYLSIYKIGKHNKGNVYLTYSPPMKRTLSDVYKYTEEQYNNALEKTNLIDYTLTPELNKYTNEQLKEPGKQLSCGYPCLPFNQPSTFKDTDGTIRQYMCGSIAYPTIKTPPRYAVYKIIEK